MPPVIQVSSVRKTYGRTIAVDEASFSVNQGEIFGLIGPNGAGKTTTMECIEGLGLSLLCAAPHHAATSRRRIVRLIFSPSFCSASRNSYSF